MGLQLDLVNALLRGEPCQMAVDDRIAIPLPQLSGQFLGRGSQSWIRPQGHQNQTLTKIQELHSRHLITADR